MSKITLEDAIMKLYWFSDEDGGHWTLIAAHNDNRAWELFAQMSYSDDSMSIEPGISIKEAQEAYVLNATTEVNDNEGEVASIFPREVYFAIKEGFGSKDLGHLRNI